MMRLFFLNVFIISFGDLICQNKSTSAILSQYPLEAEKRHFIKKIWLKKRTWQILNDDDGSYVRSRASAKSTNIRLIPIFSLRGETIEDYDSSKNILNYLVPRPGKCYLAVVRGQNKNIAIIEAWGSEVWLEKFNENQDRELLYKKINEKNVYFDLALRMYCSIEENEVYLYHPYEGKWVLFKSFISGRVKSYKDLSKKIYFHTNK